MFATPQKDGKVERENLYVGKKATRIISKGKAEESLRCRYRVGRRKRLFC